MITYSFELSLIFTYSFSLFYYYNRHWSWSPWLDPNHGSSFLHVYLSCLFGSLLWTFDWSQGFVWLARHSAGYYLYDIGKIIFLSTCPVHESILFILHHGLALGFIYPFTISLHEETIYTMKSIIIPLFLSVEIGNLLFPIWSSVQSTTHRSLISTEEENVVLTTCLCFPIYFYFRSRFQMLSLFYSFSDSLCLLSKISFGVIQIHVSCLRMLSIMNVFFLIYMGKWLYNEIKTRVDVYRHWVKTHGSVVVLIVKWIWCWILVLQKDFPSQTCVLKKILLLWDIWVFIPLTISNDLFPYPLVRYNVKKWNQVSHFVKFSLLSCFYTQKWVQSFFFFPHFLHEILLSVIYVISCLLVSLVMCCQSMVSYDFFSFSSMEYMYALLYVMTQWFLCGYFYSYLFFFQTFFQRYGFSWVCYLGSYYLLMSSIHGNNYQYPCLSNMMMTVGDIYTMKCLY